MIGTKVEKENETMEKYPFTGHSEGPMNECVQ